MEFEEWIVVGLENGWCGPPVCFTHDGVPTSEDEDSAWLDGNDLCLHVVRLYDDAAQKMAVEENHAPSQWRNHYTDDKKN